MGMEEPQPIQDITAERDRRLRQKVPAGVRHGKRAPAVVPYDSEGLKRAAKKIMHTFISGLTLDIARLDVFLAGWIALVPTRTDIQDAIDEILVTIMTDPLDVRIDNECFILTTKEWMRIYYRQMDRKEVGLLAYIVDNWKLFFGERVRYKTGTRLPSYYRCFYNADLADSLPRAAIAARFVALALRHNATGGAPDCVGPKFNTLWTACYISIRKIVRFGKDIRPDDARLLNAAVHVPPTTLLDGWDPSKSMHPIDLS